KASSTARSRRTSSMNLSLLPVNLAATSATPARSRILFTASRVVSEHLAEAVAPPTAAQASAYIR
ncbi:hypothetical protein RFX65_06615, partial [Acinetobacter baumannii]|nr:hypothetical protein [Acinetobacter baumannii]